MANTRRLSVVVALLFVLGLALAAEPASATHTSTCEFIDGVRVCTPDEHTLPVVEATNASVTVDEGRTAFNTGTFSDPDGNATVTLSASVGTVTKDDANGTWIWAFRTNDGPDQSQTVTITASDGTDTVTTTFSLTVNNVAPKIVWWGSWYNINPLEVPESDNLRGYLFEVEDPGRGDTWTVNTGCGANAVKVFEGWDWTTTYRLDCRFPDGPSSSTLSASATDNDGAASGTQTLTITVTNAPPTANFNVPASVDEGGTATISLTDQNDVQADMNAGLHYAFDCNGGSLATATYANSGTANSTTCDIGDGPGTKTVRARITDRDGGTNEYTKDIAVTNVAPRATLEAPASADQGSNFSLSLTGVVEPSGTDGGSLSYAFDCGNGSGYVSASTASKSCTALDQPTMTVKGKVTDKDGGTNEYTKTVSVNNAAPTGTIKINGDDAATNSATVSLALSATDPLPGSGVGHMRFRNENTETWSAWEPYATSRSWLLSGGDGTKTVHVEYRDNADNVSTAAIRDSILLDTSTPADTTAPSGTIKINGGAVYTKSPSVKLSLSATDPSPATGVASMRFRNDGGSWSGWTPYATTKSWTLRKANGTRTVYAQYRDKTGNLSTAARDTIKLDTARPTISGMSPRHKSIIRDTTPTIKATVKDNLTNLAKGNIKLYVNGKRISATKYSYSVSRDLLVYNSPKLSRGKKTIKIVARDAAGNVGTKSWYFTIK